MSTEPENYTNRKPNKYAMIREQIEFYLSDVNLSKDRFFRDIYMGKNGLVPINKVLDCNRVKSMTSNTKDIIKALKKSKVLAVTEDKLHIKRNTPFKEVYSDDNMILYVENVPSTSTIDSLKKVFGIYGKVNYISLPRHSDTERTLKGFGFVEFDKEEAVLRALDAFRSACAVLDGNMRPENLLSIRVVLEDEERKLASQSYAQPPKKKMKLENVIDDKMKCNPIDLDRVDNDKMDGYCADNVKIENNFADNVEKESDCADDTKVEYNAKLDNEVKLETALPAQFAYGMKILCKKDWKKLRNSYLNYNRHRGTGRKTNLAIPVPDDVIQVFTNNTDSECKVQYKENIIVKFAMNHPLKDKKLFRNAVNQTFANNIDYIDIKGICRDVYVRCKDAETAKNIVASGFWPDCTLEVLTGEEEKEYWGKVYLDRLERKERKSQKDAMKKQGVSVAR